MSEQNIILNDESENFFIITNDEIENMLNEIVVDFEIEGWEQSVIGEINKYLTPVFAKLCNVSSIQESKNTFCELYTSDDRENLLDSFELEIEMNEVRLNKFERLQHFIYNQLYTILYETLIFIIYNSQNVITLEDVSNTIGSNSINYV